MAYVELVALLAVLQYLFFGTQVSKARQLSGLKAPAMTGDTGVERMLRVHLNTLEVLMAFFPALYIAAQHWSGVLVAPVAAVFLLGRQLYWRAYIKDPSQRVTGFLLSIGAVAGLILLALAGIVRALFG